MTGGSPGQAPSISVAMATYNGLPHLKEQLESIRQQSHPPMEIVICDDASTDGTWDLLSAVSAADARVRIFPNAVLLGSTKNFEKAIALCRGDIIFLSDQDDVWSPNKVERLADALVSRNAMLAMSNGQLVNGDGAGLGMTLWQSSQIDDKTALQLQSKQAFEPLATGHYLTGSALCFRSELREYIEPIPAGVWHDRWIALIASLAAPGRVALLNEALYSYRQHAGNQIGARVPGIRVLFRRARREIVSHADVVADIEFCRSAIARLDSIAARKPASSALAPEARALLERRLGHSQSRCALIEHRLPVLSALRRERREDYKRFSRGWTTLVRDVLARVYRRMPGARKPVL